MKVGIVLPRGMHFSSSGATSIDITARDLVLNSKFRETTYVVGAAVEAPFDDLDFRSVEASSQKDFLRQAIDTLRKDLPELIVVHQHPESADKIARALPDVPVFLHRHGLLRHKRGLLSRLRKRLQFRRLAAIIFVSDFLCRRFHDDHPGSKSRTFVLHNGIDIDFWKPAAKKADQIVFVGRAREDKGVLQLIKAFRALALPNWTLNLVLAVQTENERRLADLIQHDVVGIDEIKVQENLPQSAVRDVLASSKIAAVPSIVEEGFHRVIVEAQACGCAVIASDGGGAPEAGGRECLYVQTTPDHDFVEQIEKQLQTLVSDEDKMRELGWKGSQRTEKEFSLVKIAEQYDQMISETAKRQLSY